MNRLSFMLIALLGAMVAHADTAFDELVEKSKSFLDSLDKTQRETAVLPFDNDERLNWHYFPKARKGIMLKQLNPDQKEKALAVLSTGLSQEGYATVETIRDMENVLREISPNDTTRDPLQYYVTYFGEPGSDKNWGLRYEGHHLSLHWTIVDGHIVATLPQFLGSNPGEVLAGSRKGTRALGQEEDLARNLVKSLSPEQRKAGVVSDTAPADILTGAEREAAIQEDTGIAYTDLNEEQRGILISLLQLYASVMRREQAEERLVKVRASGLDGIKFAWMGGLEKGEKHYYRIQGPTFLIEYDNTQNNANHVHTVWRDFKGDFGMDMLKEHYAEHTNATHPGQHEH
ncbi:MAG: DUF3500 domain-containing protein [Candidatus Hydrogenedentes bacterium]|nr:DUF3500 domain-containing protein [Candidatus Hydrogenedentota bacterium]